MDIDIDLQQIDVGTLFPNAVRASMVKNGELKSHPCGVYFQHIPKDPITQLSAIPYDKATNEGYFKIDLLHLNILDKFESKQEVRAAVKETPDWSLLTDDTVIEQLFHLSNWGSVLHTIQPTSIQELADCLAIIRPGKMRLLEHYHSKQRWVREELYKRGDEDKYHFKRAHAIAYAHVIVCQLYLINKERSKNVNIN